MKQVNLNVRAKLLAGFGGVCLAMAVIGVTGAVTASGLQARFDYSATNAVPSAIDLGEAQAGMLAGQSAIMSALATQDAAKTADNIKQAQAQFQTGLKAWQAYAALPASAAEMKITDDLNKRLPALQGILPQVESELAKNTDAGDQAAAALMEGQYVTVSQPVLKDLSDLIALQDSQGRDSLKQGNDAFTRSLGILLAVLLAGVGLALTIGIKLSGSISGGVRSVQQVLTSITDNCATYLEGGLKAMAENDLTVEVRSVTQPIDRFSSDEIGETARVTNRMLTKIQNTMASYEQARRGLEGLVAQVKHSAESLADASMQLGEATSQSGQAVQQVAQAIQNVATGAQDTSRSAELTNDAVKQLAQAVDSIARGATEQSQQVQEASDTATEMASGIEQVATNARNVASASELTKTAAQTGAKAVQDTVSGMSQIRDVVTRAAQKVEELGALGEKIGAVVETIDDIAEQTNLLALNAAIEAARAGEHGMGFAVVADEVRKLAERSQRETKAIADLIKEVQDGTHEAVQAMESGSSKVEDGSLKADQAGRALADILQAVESTVAQVTEIAAAAQQMASSSGTVIDSMRSISTVVEQNTAATEEMAAQSTQVLESIQTIADASVQQSAATEEVSASAEEMSAQVEEMSAQAQELAATAEELRSLVTRFKVTDEQAVRQDGQRLRLVA